MGRTPFSLKNVVLSELHKEHMGVSHIKAFTRSHVWWHGLDQDIEALAKSCQACLAHLQRHRCIHGPVQAFHGSTFTLILLGHS